MKMNRRMMKEEHGRVLIVGHVTTSIRKVGEKEIVVMGVRMRQEEDEVIDDYGNSDDDIGDGCTTIGMND